MDSERATLSPEPGLRPRGFDLGWDPQGALAARLQAAALPTVVILDRRGRITFVQAGAPPEPPVRSRTACARRSPLLDLAPSAPVPRPRAMPRHPEARPRHCRLTVTSTPGLTRLALFDSPRHLRWPG
jgi:hypothetical protein